MTHGNATQILEASRHTRRGDWHFNIGSVTLKPAFAAARPKRSSHCRSLRRRALVHGHSPSLCAPEKSAWANEIPIVLNTDHMHSLPSAIEAAEAGFDCIVCGCFDAAV